MIDFKTWRQLNESLGFNLGVSSPAKLGGVMGAFQYLDEKKKHMDADIEVDDKDMDVDGEDTKEDGEGCDKMLMSKKKSKKKMKNECSCDDKKGMMKGMKGLMGGKGDMGMDMDMGADAGMDGDMGADDMMGGEMDGDMGDEELGDEEMMGDEDMDDVDDEDIENAEEESGEDLDGDGEMGEPEDHIAKIKSKKAPMPLGFMKKKMKKENTEADFFGDLQNAYMSPKNQTNTEEEFWSSIKGYNYDPNKKFNDGFTEIKEDMLLPEQPPVVEAPAAPQPGEVGFAPQQRLDTNYQVPPLDESKKPKKSWF